MKRLTAVIVVLMLCFSAYSAVWVWQSDYINVTNFRYQVGGEDGAWRVVPAMVTRYEDPELSSGVLYVQQSLDYGRSWSPSGFAEYLEEGEEPTLSEPVEVPSEETPEAVAVEETAKPELLMEDPFSLAFVFTLAPVYERAVAGSYPFDPNAFGLEAELGFENIAGNRNASFGFDIDTGLMLIPSATLNPDWFKNMFSLDSSVYRAYADIILDLRIRMADMHLTLGVGGGAAMLSEAGYGLLDVSGFSLVPSVAGELKVDYPISSHVTTGLGVKYRYDFKPEAHRVAGCYVIGVRI